MEEVVEGETVVVEGGIEGVEMLQQDGMVMQQMGGDMTVQQMSGGMMTMEGGAVSMDGGTVIMEGGMAAMQGGTVMMEGGMVSMDGGTMMMNGGTTMVNGGVVNVNGGTVMMDGGMVTMDGGMTVVNAGVVNMSGDGGVVISGGDASIQSGGMVAGSGMSVGMSGEGASGNSEFQEMGSVGMSEMSMGGVVQTEQMGMAEIQEYGMGGGSEIQEFGMVESTDIQEFGMESGSEIQEFGMMESTEIQEYGMEGGSEIQEFGMVESTEIQEFGMEGGSEIQEFGMESTEIQEFSMEGGSEIQEFGMVESTEIQEYGMEGGSEIQEFGMESTEIQEFGMEGGSEVQEFGIEGGSEIQEFGMVESTEIQEFGMEGGSEIQEYGMEGGSEIQEFGMVESTEIQEFGMEGGSEIQEYGMEGGSEVQEYGMESTEIQEFGMESTEIQDMGMVESTEIQEFSMEGGAEIQEIGMIESTEIQDMGMVESTEIQEIGMVESTEIQEFSMENGSEIQEIGIVESTEIQEFSMEGDSEIQEFGIVESTEIQEFGMEGGSEIQEFGTVESTEIQEMGMVESSTIEEIGTIESTEIQEFPLDDSTVVESFEITEIGTVGEISEKPIVQNDTKSTVIENRTSAETIGAVQCEHKEIFSDLKERVEKLEEERSTLEDWYNSEKTKRETIEEKYSRLFEEKIGETPRETPREVDHGDCDEKYREIIKENEDLAGKYDEVLHMVNRYEDEMYQLKLEMENVKSKNAKTVHNIQEIVHVNKSSSDDSSDRKYYEDKITKLERENKYLEEKCETVRNERDDLESKYRTEKHERDYYESKYNELNSSLTTYEETNRTLSVQVETLNAQIRGLQDDLDNMRRRGTDDRREIHVEFQQQAVSHETKSVDDYRRDIAALARENEEFRKIIDKLENKTTVKQYVQEFNINDYVLRSEYLNLKEDKLHLEEMLENLQKKVRRQSKIADDNVEDIYEEKAKMRDNMRRLEDQLRDNHQLINDYEKQILTLKGSFTEEVAQLERMMMSEVEQKSRLEQYLKSLEKDLVSLECERKDFSSKINDAQMKEHTFVMEIRAIESRYSSQVENLQRRLNDELQQKAALSSDIRVLLSDITSLKTRQQNLEEEYKRQKDELKEQFEKEKSDVINQYLEQTNQIRSELNGQAQRRDNIERQSKNLSVQIDSTRSTYDAARGVVQDDVDSRLMDEINKREAVEQENKKLLYEMNALLSRSQSSPAKVQSGTREMSDSGTSGFRVHGDDAQDDTRTRELEKEVKRLKRVVEDLRSSDSEKSDLEDRNKELEDEVNYMSIKRKEMLERQKGLVDNIDKLTSSVKEMETHNTKLSEELFRLTVKLENLEQGKTSPKAGGGTIERQERDLATEEIIREKRELEGRVKDQDNKNRSLEDTIRRLETDFQSMLNGNGPQRGMGQAGVNQYPGMNQCNPVVDQQKQEWENLLQSTTEKHRNEVDKMEEQKQRMKDDFDREREDMRRRYDDQRRDFERKMKDLETNIRNSSNHAQNNQVPRDDSVLIQLETIRHQFEIEKGELERRYGNEKQQLKIQFDVLIDEEKRRFNSVTTQQEDTIRNLRNAQRDLEDRLKDMERRNERERYEMTLKFNDEKKRLQDDLEIDFKRRLENVKHEYQRHTVDEGQASRAHRDNRAVSQGRSSIRELITEDRLKEIVSTVLKDHGKPNNARDSNVDKKIADIQRVFEREKIRVQQDRDNSLRQAEQKKAAIEVKVLSLTSEILKLKEEKKELWRTHRLEKDRLEEEFRRKEREMKNNWVKSKEDLTIKLQKDFSLKLVREKMPLKNALDEMKRKLVSAETKLRDLVAKTRDEKRDMENAWDQERIDWKKKLEDEKKKLQTHLEGEFLRKITKEKEIYERTLQELRYEISQLQDQRRLIQAKISSEEFASSRVTIDQTSVISRNTTLKREEEFNMKVKREKRVLNERIEQLEAEIELLQKENHNCRASLKQEKAKLKSEFEQERDRVVDKMRKEKETMRTMYEERLKMDPNYNQVGRSKLQIGGGDSKRGFQKSIKDLLDQNHTLKSRNELLEKDLRVMVGRMDSLALALRQLQSSGEIKDQTIDKLQAIISQQVSEIASQVAHSSLTITGTNLGPTGASGGEGTTGNSGVADGGGPTGDSGHPGNTGSAATSGYPQETGSAGNLDSNGSTQGQMGAGSSGGPANLANTTSGEHPQGTGSAGGRIGNGPAQDGGISGLGSSALRMSSGLGGNVGGMGSYTPSGMSLDALNLETWPSLNSYLSEIGSEQTIALSSSGIRGSTLGTSDLGGGFGGDGGIGYQGGLSSLGSAGYGTGNYGSSGTGSLSGFSLPRGTQNMGYGGLSGRGFSASLLQGDGYGGALSSGLSMNHGYSGEGLKGGSLFSSYGLSPSSRGLYGGSNAYSSRSARFSGGVSRPSRLVSALVETGGGSNIRSMGNFGYTSTFY